MVKIEKKLRKIQGLRKIHTRTSYGQIAQPFWGKIKNFLGLRKIHTMADGQIAQPFKVKIFGT